MTLEEAFEKEIRAAMPEYVYSVSLFVGQVMKDYVPQELWILRILAIYDNKRTGLESELGDTSEVTALDLLDNREQIAEKVLADFQAHVNRS